MSISILVEPIATGFRASTGGPLDLSSEGPTAADALTLLQTQIAQRFAQGSFMIEQPLPAPRGPLPITPLAENPLFGEWLESVERYREEKEKQDREIYG